MNKELEIKSRIRKELDDINREYRIYCYSYKTTMISALILCIVVSATYFKLISFMTLTIGWIVLGSIIVFSGFTFLKYYNRIHENPGMME